MKHFFRFHLTINQLNVNFNDCHMLTCSYYASFIMLINAICLLFQRKAGMQIYRRDGESYDVGVHDSGPDPVTVSRALYVVHHRLRGLHRIVPLRHLRNSHSGIAAKYTQRHLYE